MFDAACRCGPGGKQTERIASFGLDDDPRYEGKRVNQAGGAIDLLRELPGEPISRRPVRLASNIWERGSDFSMRLFRLALWITQVADSPTAVWWAARQGHLNSGLVDKIKNRLNAAKSGSPLVRQAWRFVLEALEISEDSLIHERTFASATQQDEGWSAHALWMFERYIRPRVTLVQANELDFPPKGVPSSLKDLAKFKVVYPGLPFGGDGSNWVTDELEFLVRALEGGLLAGIRLEREIYGWDFQDTERGLYEAKLKWLRDVLAERKGVPVDGRETAPTVPRIEVAEFSADRQITEATGSAYNSPISHSHAENVSSKLFKRWAGLVEDPTSSLSSAELRIELKAATDAVRFDTIQTFRGHMCSPIVGGGAAGEVFRRFIQEAWPGEPHFQTAATTEQIIFVLSRLGDAFAQGVELAKHCLVPMPWLSQVFSYLGFGPEAADGDSPCYQRDPRATFVIVYGIFNRANPLTALDLGGALTRLSEREPGLLRDRRYQEMVTFVRQHGGS